mmetsp:Transcript_31207/g.79460  ORF Transcript_31207/g.79460 Transcript_31207/m.79460 type:complete len:444 (+) Transcript_31207:134-1465(+)|eukprot:CAMPEP_0195062370 /NCGR_PEP_ID=MMETSP0448-20130528/9012_1 /TAXON_ID=66468 /ORGANISM="Heterocapsa triquestra, Strain CCMP 448" /LENGTH=443 /DNA_ID=CAMNT_0040093049 /DNA_START=134 /DNA_END=1465 /DNA_ORIENTATION=+
MAAALSQALVAAACLLASTSAMDPHRRAPASLRGPSLVGLLDTGSLLLRGKVSDYYAAAGAYDALPKDLINSRVGGNNLQHIFYLPKGVAGLELGAQMKGRHEAMSMLQQMRSKEELQNFATSGFPVYTESANYTNPLSAAGQEAESKAVATVSASKLMQDLNAICSSPGSSQEPTRSWSNPEATAAIQDMLKQRFSAMGLNACMQTFKSNAQANVVAFLAGEVADAVVIGAHYDSRPFEGKAPGAVDNGSGVAALVSIARAITAAGVRPRKSVYFVAFAAEEPGLEGSTVFAQELLKDGLASSLPSECRPASSLAFEQAGAERYHAVIMDEVAWRSPKLGAATVNLESYDWARDVLKQLVAASHTHNGENLTVVHSNMPFGSDHMPFLNGGMQAALTIMGDDTEYPSYHQSTDVVANVDPQLMEMVTKMIVGGVLRLTGVRE